jgi:Domain of unknown function (DUF4190)
MTNTQINPDQTPSTNPATSGFAIVSLILGLVGGGILAVVFGHLAKREIRQTGKQGSGMATAGLWLGYITSAFWILIWIAVIGGAMSTDTSYTPSNSGDTRPASVSRLEMLHDDCAGGDMGACDDLFIESPIGSADEEFGSSCAGRQLAYTAAWCE